MIEVLQVNDKKVSLLLMQRFKPDAKAVGQLIVDGCYVHVASVESDSLDMAYERTNSINQAWVLNSGVEVQEAAKGGCRSTSVGDVMIAGGEMYVVSAFGFDKINLEVRA